MTSWSMAEREQESYLKLDEVTAMFHNRTFFDLLSSKLKRRKFTKRREVF